MLRAERHSPDAGAVDAEVGWVLQLRAPDGVLRAGTALVVGYDNGRAHFAQGLQCLIPAAAPGDTWEAIGRTAVRGEALAMVLAILGGKRWADLSISEREAYADAETALRDNLMPLPRGRVTVESFDGPGNGRVTLGPEHTPCTFVKEPL